MVTRALPSILFTLIIFGTVPAVEANSWRELGPLNIGRTGCKAHSIDGDRAIVLAGWGDEVGPADTSAEILDTTTGQWLLTSPMPAGFAPGAAPWTAKLKNGYFLIAGGFNAFRETQDLSSYVYAVSTDTWIRTGDLPPGSTVVSNFGQTNAIVLDDGRVLTATGLSIGVGESNVSTVFTPNYANLGNGLSGNAAGTWDFTRDRRGNVTKLNGASEHHTLIKLADGRVLLIHGNDRLFNSVKWGSVYRDTLGVQAELFDPKNGTWSALPKLPAIPGEDDRHSGVKGVRQLPAVALLSDGRVLVSGGFSQPADARGKPLLKDLFYVRSSAILFDPTSFDAGANPWSITDAMHVARHSHVMGNLAGSAGIISAWGWTRNEWTATVEVYQQGAWQVVTGLPALPGADLAISLPWGCSAMMPGGRLLLTGGSEEVEAAGTSRRTYYYQP
jgi:hypothetical protein